MNFIVLTGLSGSGKTQAANALEDAGYYCIDNMPAVLIPKFVEIYQQSPGKSEDVAFIIDARGEIEFHTLFSGLDALKKQGYSCELIFLDCADAVLMNRYKESRRLHPFAHTNRSLSEAIRTERAVLSDARARADYIIDTSSLTTRQLRDKIFMITSYKKNRSILINCISFGFKYGIAAEADLVFDVRCFPNPFYEPDLKDLTGLSPEVRDFVFASDGVKRFMNKLYDMLDFLLPLYIEEGKSQLGIAFGCTGGKHRSVALCEATKQHFEAEGANVAAIHRDIDKK